MHCPLSPPVPALHHMTVSRRIHSHDGSIPPEEENRLLCDPDVPALHHDRHPLPGLLLAQPRVGAGQDRLWWALGQLDRRTQCVSCRVQGFLRAGDEGPHSSWELTVSHLLQREATKKPKRGVKWKTWVHVCVQVHQTRLSVYKETSLASLHQLFGGGLVKTAKKQWKGSNCNTINLNHCNKLKFHSTPVLTDYSNLIWMWPISDISIYIYFHSVFHCFVKEAFHQGFLL